MAKGCNIIKRIHRRRNLLSDCGRELFKGTETIEELAEIFRSPQGAEFCEEHNFPDIETWRELDSVYDLRRFGIYVDAGTVLMTNVPHVTLIGNTTKATLYYNELKRHTVTLMHGAKAKIVATGWAVVFVRNGKGCEVASETEDRAKIL